MSRAPEQPISGKVVAVLADDEEATLAQPLVAEQTDAADSEEELSFRQLLTNTLPAWLISLLCHSVGVVVLSAVTVANLATESESIGLSAAKAEVTEVEVLAEIDEEALEDDLPQSEAFAAEEMQAADVLGSLEVAVDPSMDFVMPTASMPEIGSLVGASDAVAAMGNGLSGATFFGAKSEGDKFVFVVDNSNSMTRGRLETALTELMATVDEMNSKKYFYVIFFSDTAYEMFHPRPAGGFVKATPRNKEKLRAWLYSVQMCLKTKGEEAVAKALSLRPDVIYILGDGAFTDKTAQVLTKPHQRIVPINTLGMEVDGKGEKQLKAIAAANMGTYRLVSASNEARESAKKHPIPRNNTKGPVWGVTLPPPKK